MTHTVTRPRPLYIPPSSSSPEPVQSPRLLQAAAVVGIPGLSQRITTTLQGISHETLSRLNTAFSLLDARQTGYVSASEFTRTVQEEDLAFDEREMRELSKAYALDKYERRIWWGSFLNDIKKLIPPLPASPSSPTSSRSLSPGRESLESSRTVGQEASSIIKQLANFCRQRRVNVENAFFDFERPGKFCKRVQRVTRDQFKEVLNFILNGLHQLSDEEFKELADCYDDGTGLIRYRDFTKAVDPYMEPGTGFSPVQSPGRRSTSPRRSISSSFSGGSLSPSMSPNSVSLLGVQPMGPPECQAPGRIEVFERLRVDDIMAKLRHLCQIYSIILVDHLKPGDRHNEGLISPGRFGRCMDNLKVLRLNAAEQEVLVRHYKADVVGDPTFNYRRFCEDLQPTGPDLTEKLASLRRDDTTTSPLAVKELMEEEMLHLTVLHKRLGAAVQKKRIGFRTSFSDFDRVTKTRSGSTQTNYTLNPGCISRSQFLQALRGLGLSSLLDTDDLELLFKRYEREGGFNHLVFLRDIEQEEAKIVHALYSPNSPSSPAKQQAAQVI
mmetsp:Transcript_42065/g.85882  ORF Transcript_42065/g.85882 Transcript_42065/m.85882 type:complete len:554 (-) Transcript_42065:110-1771(-)|eukprot:CAMPEP_0181299228 /NCGR_PEP_ID=MMETSP1101-20121128/6227_1 /TAXON_ID=46948 /ORGANISM="Rhodomonas abbreviata, Strain Caron Lab Isolate" /LENGTH=553 /DNA_ID=CAMNT_0023404349 /DNA_START=198 /DNA_END=1859 /DNA_ORIENTATION=-